MGESKIIREANTISANHKKAMNGLSRVTGVVNDYAKASKADRANIKATIKAAEAQLHTDLSLAIQDGEAKAKAVEQRIAEHLKGVKRFLQVELASQVAGAADNVFKIIEGKRHKIADNYVTKGSGKGLSAIGDLLETIAALGALKAKP